MEETVFLDVGLLSGAHREGPFVLPWPKPGNPGGFLSFHDASEWRDFILSLSLSPGIPEIVAVKFRRAQMLYFLAWLYYDLIKAGELVGLTTLELALRDRYGEMARGCKRGKSFADLLKCLLLDGLTDDKVLMVQRTGGSIIGILNGDRKPTLAKIRNTQTHGDPFDGFTSRATNAGSTGRLWIPPHAVPRRYGYPFGLRTAAIFPLTATRHKSITPGFRITALTCNWEMPPSRMWMEHSRLNCLWGKFISK